MKINNPFINKMIFAVKKHSPEILVVAGVVGTVTSTVLACRATLKINDVLDETKEVVDKIHEVSKQGNEGYTEKDAKKDLTIVYVQTAVKVAKLYAPSVILGTLSITSIFASNNILRKRNMALAAAYAGIDKSFKEYRKRVVDKFGEEVDKELRYGVKKDKIEEEQTDENGKTKKVKKTVDVSQLGEYSDYAFYFDKDTSVYYKGNDLHDLMFLRSTQNYLNDMLRVKGFLTLNEALDALGVRLTGKDILAKAGLVVGWRYDKENPDGDNHVDLRITQTYRKREDGKVEPCIILDPNVDGNIYDKM